MDGRDDMRSDPRDYVLDIASLAGSPAGSPPAAPLSSPSPTAPPHAPADSLSIHFKCCNVYARIRLTADASAYAGHCPRCARPIRVLIDPNSTNTGKFFAVE